MKYFIPFMLFVVGCYGTYSFNQLENTVQENIVVTDLMSDRLDVLEKRVDQYAESVEELKEVVDRLADLVE